MTSVQMMVNMMITYKAVQREEDKIKYVSHSVCVFVINGARLNPAC